MKTSISQRVAAGHFLQGGRAIKSISVDGKKIDLGVAREAIEAAVTNAETYRTIDETTTDPGRLARARHVLEQRIAQPLKSMATATIATIGSTTNRIRGRTGDAAVQGALDGAAFGRAASNPRGVRAWLSACGDRANFLRLVGLEVLSSYHPDKVSDRHDVKIEFEDGETVSTKVEVVDHAASYRMNRYVAAVSGVSLVPPGFPTGLGTFGATAIVMWMASYLAAATGRRGLAASMRRVGTEAAVLAPVALTSLAADAVYVGASAVHLAMHKTVKESDVVKELSAEDIEKSKASFKERVGDAKNRARRQIELTKKARVLAKKDPAMLELLHRIATEEAQQKIEDAIALHERAERAEAAGLHMAASKLEDEAEHAAEKAVDARRVEILSEEVMLEATGEGSKKGAVIGRIVDAEKHQVVPDTDHQVIDPSAASKLLDVVAGKDDNPKSKAKTKTKTKDTK